MIKNFSFKFSKECILLLALFFSYGLSAQDTEKVIPQTIKYGIKKIVDGHFSNPICSPDGRYITFTSSMQEGIYIMDKEGGGVRTLVTHTGAGYKYAWSLDNECIAYRGTTFEGSERMQFIAVININDNTDTVLFMFKRLQPPVWRYADNRKNVVFVVNDEVIDSGLFPFVADTLKEFTYNPLINTFFYYKEGGFYIVTEGSRNINKCDKIEGMDPVFSPDRNKFVYAKADELYLYSLENKTNVLLDKGCHPFWSPDSKNIVYQKTSDDGHIITSSDLYIMNLDTKKTECLTNTDDIFESNPFWTNDGKSILFDDEKNGGIYLITFY